MTSGRFGTSSLALWLLCTAAVAAPDPGRLLAAVAAAAPAELPFVERRTLSLLDQVVEVRGTLRFIRPARLEKQVTAPNPELLVVDGRRVTVSRPDRAPLHLSLDDAPALDALIGSFRATLAGDLAELDRHYTTAVSGDEAAWTLHLTPKDTQLAARVEGIDIDGQGARLLRFTLRERGGDRSVLDLAP